jgi:hypothetical protein
MIEGHARLTPAEAIKIGSRLEQYNPTWFEAPIQAYQGPAAFREVREALTIPVSDDLASIESKFDAFDHISERTVDVIQPDAANSAASAKSSTLHRWPMRPRYPSPPRRGRPGGNVRDGPPRRGTAEFQDPGRIQ